MIKHFLTDKYSRCQAVVDLGMRTVLIYNLYQIYYRIDLRRNQYERRINGDLRAFFTPNGAPDP